MQYMTAIVFTH